MRKWATCIKGAGPQMMFMTGHIKPFNERGKFRYSKIIVASSRLLWLEWKRKSSQKMCYLLSLRSLLSGIDKMQTIRINIRFRLGRHTKGINGVRQQQTIHFRFGSLTFGYYFSVDNRLDELLYGLRAATNKLQTCVRITRPIQAALPPLRAFLHDTNIECNEKIYNDKL